MSEELIITHVPSLVAILLNKEREKGQPLTKEEVESIRDEAPCIALTPEKRAAIDEQRQYEDIDPEQVWNQWEVARIELNSLDDSPK